MIVGAVHDEDLINRMPTVFPVLAEALQGCLQRLDPQVKSHSQKEHHQLYGGMAQRVLLNATKLADRIQKQRVGL